MNPDQFFFHDLSQFPIVTARHGGAPLGYSATWIREMELLVENPRMPATVLAERVGWSGLRPGFGRT